MPLKLSRYVLDHFWTASASSPTQLLAILYILEFLHVFYLNGMPFKPQSVCGAALVGGIHFQFCPQGLFGFSYPTLLSVRIHFLSRGSYLTTL